VLEWCQNTMPLGAYLEKAHPRHRPKDLKPQEARAQLASIHERDKKDKQKFKHTFDQRLKVRTTSLSRFNERCYLLCSSTKICALKFAL